MLPTTAEIVIIGGGVMGVSAAYHLARAGVRDVVLLERAAFFGQGSTGRCAGGIRHQFSTGVNIELSKASIAMLRRFEDEIGQAIDLKLNGYLFLLSTEAELAQFRQNVALQNAHGIASQVLTVDEIAARVPLVNLNRIIGGTYYAGDGIADPSGVVNGYAAAAKRHGAQLFNGVDVTGIAVQSGRVGAVHTAQGVIHTPRVLIAAGAWSGQVGAMAGVALPITPENQQILVTQPIPELPPDFPFVIDFHQRLYFHLESGGLLTGLSKIGQPSTFSEAVDEEWTFTHIEKAIERLPLLERAAKRSEWAGLYEVTPDAHPIIDHVPEVAGLTVCAGFSGHGFMHGPIAGLLCAELITEGRAHTVDIAALKYTRFTAPDTATLQEFNVV
jgi:sarcosine oxidase, subunit beta